MQQKAIPVAILMFNVGVESGQLIFVTAALAAGAMLSHLRLPSPERLNWAVSHSIGTIATVCDIERIASFT